MFSKTNNMTEDCLPPLIPKDVKSFCSFPVCAKIREVPENLVTMKYHNYSVQFS